MQDHHISKMTLHLVLIAGYIVLAAFGTTIYQNSKHATDADRRTDSHSRTVEIEKLSAYIRSNTP